MQLVRVTCIFTGHYNTDLHVAFTDDKNCKPKFAKNIRGNNIVS